MDATSEESRSRWRMRRRGAATDASSRSRLDRLPHRRHRTEMLRDTVPQKFAIAKIDGEESRSRWRRRRRRRHRRERSQPPGPASPPPPPQRSESLPARFVQYVENKMGLPPPYEQSQSNPAPPPSYFGDNPPPPPGFVAPAAAPRTMVITNPTTGGETSEPQVKLGPGRTGTTCTTCNKSIVTRVDYVPNNRTHIVSAALCVLAGCCCACFVPYCMRSCKTANHYCPKCRAFVGSYTPS